MRGYEGIQGYLGILGASGIRGVLGVGTGELGEGGGQPLPPLRPNSYLKYSFNQRDLTAAITDRVTGTDQLTTTIGTDVNAVQTIDGGIRTFEYGENLIPSSLLDWAGTGGTIFKTSGGSEVFTNDTGFGEVECTVAADGDRCILQSVFDVQAGLNVFSVEVLSSSTFDIVFVDILTEIGDGVRGESKVNGQIVDPGIPRQFLAGDVVETVYDYPADGSTELRTGLGCGTLNTIAGSTIKLTQPMVNTGTERGPFVQPDGNPVTKYTQAFDVGIGAFIEPAAITQIPTDMTLWDDSANSTATYNAATKENRWTFDGGNQPHRFFTTSSVTDELDYVMSAEFKKGESQFVQIAGSAGFQNFAINYDLVNVLANQVTSFSTVRDFGLIDIGDSYIVYAVAESNSTTQGRMILAKADSLNTPRLGATSDSGAFTVKYPNFVQASVLSSPISAPFGPAQRDASTPTIPNSNIPNSEIVVYDEYINLATYDEFRLLWLYSNPDSGALVAVVDSGTGGGTLQLVRADDNGTLLAPLDVTLSQPVARNDLMLVSAYLKSDLFTLTVENKTTGEFTYSESAEIAGIIEGLGPIALGDAGSIASTFSRKVVDFEVTAYTDPPLPDFIDNGDFDLSSGDFDNG